MFKERLCEHHNNNILNIGLCCLHATTYSRVCNVWLLINTSASILAPSGNKLFRLNLMTIRTSQYYNTSTHVQMQCNGRYVECAIRTIICR
jgi:hypothetical protein